MSSSTVYRGGIRNLIDSTFRIDAGARHTTVTALQEHAGPDQVKKLTQHETNQAFERYLFPDQSKQIEMATLAEPQQSQKSPQKNRQKK